MIKYIDLTHVIKSDIPTYPGDAPLLLERHRFLSKDAYNDSKLETGMHVGTHLDVASHLSDQEIYVCDYTPDKFIGRGCLLDVRDEMVITMKTEYEKLVQEDDIVLLYTGFDQYFEDENYFLNHPLIDESLAKFFVSKKVKLVGMDLPSPDMYPFLLHKLLLENDVLIIENLRGLGQLKEVGAFDVIAMPLNIRAEGSFVRVVAKVDLK